MNNKIALDTNILIQYFRNDSDVLNKLADIEEISIPAIVIGELLAGIYYNPLSELAQKRLDAFLSKSETINCDARAADKYGEVFSMLKKNGAMIPTNDIWIAACCLVNDATLITRDKHFNNVPELKIECW